MKRIITLLVIFASMCVAGPLIRAEASDESGCSNATLQGSYGFRSQGIVPAPGGHNGGVGVATFDGNGNVVIVATFVSEGFGVSRSTSSVTYTVNPNCTGSVDFGGGAIDEFVIADGGNEIFVIAIRQDNRVVIRVGKKQFPERHGEEKD